MSKQRTVWTSDRIARLGFLVGQGFAAKRIADDPLIASTPNNVHRQAQRFGLAFREATTPLRLTPEAAAHYDAAAEKRGLTRESLIRLLVMTAAGEPNLLDNILDDGE